MFNLYKYIGLRYLKLKPGRVILTTLGVAFGIALYVAIAIINHSTQNSMRDSIESIAGKAKLTITSGTFGFDESKLEIIRVVPGVKNAVPMIEARAFFEGATTSVDGLYILGVDLLQEAAIRTYKTTDEGAGQRVIDDPLTFLNQPDSIVITQNLATARHLHVDTKMKLSTAHGLKTFTVRGILEPEGAAKAYGGTLAIMDIDGARMMFGKENKIDRIDVVPSSGVTVPELKERLEKALGPSFSVVTPSSQSEQMEALISSYQVILTFFSSLALLVGLFLVMNSISVSVAERRKEIGTLRALGATRTSMVLLFVSEIFGIGLIGSLIGCGLGRLLADYLVVQVTNSVSAQFQTRIQIAHLDFTKEQFIFSIFLGTFASILAAFIPAAQAATVHPLESMKNHAENTSREDDRKSNWVVLAGFLLLVFMSVSMYFDWGKHSEIMDRLTRGSTVLSTALFGPFLVYLLFLGMRKLTRRFSSPVLKLSQENLVRSRRRTTSNVMPLMVGLYLVMLIACVRSSFHDTITDWLNQVFIAELMVTSSGQIITADVQPLPDTIATELLQVSGVRAIGANRGVGTRMTQIHYHGQKMVLKAHDHFPDFYHYRSFNVIHGDREATAKLLYERTPGSGEELDQTNMPPRVLLTPNFLQRENLHVGEHVVLDTPSGQVSFEIVGELNDYASPSGVIYMNRQVYKKYWKDPMVTSFLINVEPGHSLEEVRARIDRELGKKYNLVTISNAEFHLEMQKAIERSFAYTSAIEVIALLVGLMGLLNTLLISVMERTREIGMLRAVGTTRTQISRMILLEAVFQGFFGALVALLLGAWVGYLFVTYSLTSSLGWIVDFYFPRQSIFNTIATGVIVAMIAGALPARRAAKLNITEALDYE
jgi:putative ABC transport system permease protein